MKLSHNYLLASLRSWVILLIIHTSQGFSPSKYPIITVLPSSSPRYAVNPYIFDNSSVSHRRNFIQTVSTCFTTTTLVSFPPQPVLAVDETAKADKKYAYELRDRNKNKNALVRDDIWYFYNQCPPRKIDLSNLPPGPKWNTWGTCSSSESTGNSCTYVSLKQKIPAYSKYGFIISLGAKEYSELGNKLRSIQTNVSSKSDSELSNISSDLYSIIDNGKEGFDGRSTSKSPSTASDALLKMVLLSTAMLTSPNYSGPPFELLIARFYVNEVDFAQSEIRDALRQNDFDRALGAWEFGRDSWNSYFTILNKAIVPKVGDKFVYINN